MGSVNDDLASRVRQHMESTIDRLAAEALSGDSTTASTAESGQLTMASIREAMDRLKDLPKVPAPVRIVSSPGMMEQFRFPRSKGKRLRKKWRKDRRNWRPMRSALHDVERGVVYAHPVVVERLRRQTHRVIDEAAIFGRGMVLNLGGLS